MTETHLVPDFGDHDDDIDDSHQDYLDAERDAEMLPDPTEPPEPEEHTTPAIVGAAQAIYELTFAGHYTDDEVHREVHEGMARAALGALDVAMFAKVLEDHHIDVREAGNGYTEPREHWHQCACGEVPWAWQQFYAENETDPDEACRLHLAAAFRAALLGEEAKTDG